MPAPRTLFLDVENTPIKIYAWELYETNAIEVVEDWHMLSFAYQWAGEKRVTVKALPDYRLYQKDKKNDRELIKDLHSILDEADVVIGHNAAAFDTKKSNSRFIYHGLGPPSPYRVYDTLKIARKVAKFSSNKLDSLAQYFKIGRKLPHQGKHTWLGCMEGDARSWETMRRYNAHDVAPLLTGVWEKLKPWANIDLRPFNNTQGCPVCLSHKIQRRGISVARRHTYQRYNCAACGHWFSGERCKTI